MVFYQIVKMVWECFKKKNAMITNIDFPAQTNFTIHAYLLGVQGGGPRVVVSTAAFHARVRGSDPGLGGLKETKMFLPHPRVKLEFRILCLEDSVISFISPSSGVSPGPA